MKRLLGFLFLLLLAPSLSAQVTPVVMRFQTRLLDASGAAVTQTGLAVTVKLYNASLGGAPFFVETHSVDTDGGLLGFDIGSVTALDSSLIAGPLPVFVGISVGADSEMVPRVRIGSMPLAKYAESAATADDVPGKDITPNSVTVNGFPVIDSMGNWIGSSSGLSGPQGPQGDPGLPGAEGPVGSAGPIGPQGLAGDPGLPGATGPAGSTGSTGPIGPQGLAGDPGLPGATGPAGSTGPIGPQGLAGDPGLPGTTGPAGSTGPIGPIGPQGLAGDPGLPGTTGPAGSTGSTGPIGPQGLAGDPGLPGATGPAGSTGSTGPIGPQGLAGDPGLPGATGPAGSTGSTGPIGPQGLAGDPGLPGSTGPAGSTGPIGPQGLAGDPGLPGATGPAGSIGPIGPQGLQGDSFWAQTGGDVATYTGGAAFGQVAVTPSAAAGVTELMLAGDAGAAEGAVFQYDGGANKKFGLYMRDPVGSNGPYLSVDPVTEKVTIGSGPGDVILGNSFSGRVGIGTTNPQTGIDMQGDGTDVGGVPGVLDVISRTRNVWKAGDSAVSVDASLGKRTSLYFAEDGTAAWGLSHNSNGLGDFGIDLLKGASPGHERALDIQYVPKIGPLGVEDHFDMTLDGRFLPKYDGADAQSLGGPLDRWSRVHLVFPPSVSSDVRLKSHIEPLAYGLDEVMRMKPKMYDMRAGGEIVPRQIGLIAQELREVIPEVVSVPETEEEFLSVTYTSLIPVLVQAIQDQQAQIDAQAIELAEVKALLLEVLGR